MLIVEFFGGLVLVFVIGQLLSHLFGLHRYFK
jgi:hypothetical protein